MPLVVAVVIMAVVVVVGGVVLLSSGGDDDGGDGETAGSATTGAAGDEQGSPPGPDQTTPPSGDPESDGEVPPPDVQSAEPDADGNTPDQVVRTYFEADTTGDCELMRQTVTDEAWTEGGAMTEQESMEACIADGPLPESPLRSAELFGVYSDPPPALEQDGMRPDTAVVRCVTTEGDGEYWLVIDEGGLWRIY